MTDLNDLFKVIAEGKKDYEENDPNGKIIKEVKNNVKEDIGSLFGQLSALKQELEHELVIEEKKLTHLIDEEQLKLDAKSMVNDIFSQLSTPVKEQKIINEVSKLIADETLQATEPLTPQEKIVKTEVDVNKHHTNKSFQQPNPDLVSKNVEDIRNKIKFLEQAIGKIAATGPGGGEVNLRWLDDVARETIGDNKFLRYNAELKKFDFVPLSGSGTPQVQSDWNQSDNTKVDYIKNKPTIPDITEIENTLAATGEPMGHTNKSQSVISFDDASRTFSISPVGESFEIWTKGTRRTITDTRQVTIPDTTGLYYIYFDTAGVLQYKTTFYDWPNDCMTAYVYWNDQTNDAPFVADERHGITLDWQTHEYLHRTRGAAIANGFDATNYIVLGDGSLDSHMQLDISSGTFFDEDLQVDIVNTNTPTANTWEQDLSGPAKIPMFYINSGGGWVMDTPTNFPIKQGTLPKYNLYSGGVWTTPDIDNNKFGVTFIIATNNINYPIIGIIGQASHANIGAAESTEFSDLNLAGFPVVEMRPLYKLVYECKASYTNSVNARLVSIWDQRSFESTTSAIATYTDHGALGGLTDDDHPQYLLRTDAPTNVSAFTNDSGYLTSVSWSQVTSKPQSILTLNDVNVISNDMLINKSITIGSTAVELGSSITTLTGLTGVTSNSATAFIAGAAAESNVALQMPRESALRNLTNGFTNMYFDVSIGGSAHGAFQFRSSNGYTNVLTMSPTSVTFNTGATVTARTPSVARTGFNSPIDTEIIVDEMRFRISNQGGIFPQVIGHGSSRNLAWTGVGAISGAAVTQVGSTGTIVASNAWTTLYNAHGMDSSGDTITVTLQDKAGGRIYRVTFMRSDNGSTTGYNIIGERLL